MRLAASQEVHAAVAASTLTALALTQPPMLERSWEIPVTVMPRCTVVQYPGSCLCCWAAAVPRRVVFLGNVLCGAAWLTDSGLCMQAGPGQGRPGAAGQAAVQAHPECAREARGAVQARPGWAVDSRHALLAIAAACCCPCTG